ncbi:MAG: hypothetical protein E6J36_10375 [Chloroflexi bacterium]|nr:MAG: hypothetical protein E6J36_10375 [Chloroflexota bacterium]TMD61284.1 MAG: hypothetical protein E6I97_27480 [Chloroflexota bacterium]
MRAHGARLCRERKRDRTNVQFAWLSFVAGVNHDDEVYRRYPAVMECAIIAIPDEQWGERPKAFLTLKEGQCATEEEIIVFCRQYLAHFKCPAAVTFGNLPKTSTGKVQKYVLREGEWGKHAKRIN